MKKGFLNTPQKQLVVVTKEEKVRKAIQLIKQFVLNTVVGTLSGLYKVYNGISRVPNEYFEEIIKKSTLCDETFWVLFSMQIVDYLNNTDAWIRNRQDPYINGIFDPVKKELGRLPCCIIAGIQQLFSEFSQQCIEHPELMKKNLLSEFIESGLLVMKSIYDFAEGVMFKILMTCSEKCSKSLEQEQRKITL